MRLTPRRLIVFFGICTTTLIFFFFLFALGTRDYETSDPVRREIIKESKQFFIFSDRCDPAPCLDRFQVIDVDQLTEPQSLFNTGAAAISIDPVPETFPKAKVTIIESQNLTKNNLAFAQQICPAGAYIVRIIYRDWAFVTRDQIRLCYRLT